MPIVFYYGRLLQDLNICTCVPYLRTFQTIPAERQDIISRRQVRWNFDHILESPPILGPQSFGNGYFGPFWPSWSCPSLCRFQFHGYPTILEELVVCDLRFPINPRSLPCPLPTQPNSLFYKWNKNQTFELYFNQLSQNFCFLPEKFRCPCWKQSSVTFQYSGASIPWGTWHSLYA